MEATGRYTLLPRTTKRRTPTNLKTNNNQNTQKIKLYGSPTTKKLKKKHSSRQVEGVTGIERTHSKMAARGPEQVSQWLAEQEIPHLPADKLGETTGE